MRKTLSVTALFVGIVIGLGASWPGSGLSYFNDEAPSDWQIADPGRHLMFIAQADTKPGQPDPSAAPAPATTEPEPAQDPGWAVNCKSEAQETGLDCSLSQTVVLKQSGQVLTKVTFRVPGSANKPEVIIQLPLRLYLPAGATFQVDEGTPQRLTFRACDRSGCYAQSEISSEVLAKLRGGKQLTVSFKNLAEKDISVPLSLNGFGDAYAKVEGS
jgi:invasion protein IalB